ncbi:hypothetical protein [Pedobacter africanus]|nr:hypothetical protein [Pedobacter africanus]
MKTLLESPEKKSGWLSELAKTMDRELLSIFVTVILERLRRTARRL